MNYKRTATVVASTLLALAASAPAHADNPTNHLTTDDVGNLLSHTDDALDTLRNGGLTRNDSLVKGNPKRTKTTLAGIPLGITTPN